MQLPQVAARAGFVLVFIAGSGCAPGPEGTPVGTAGSEHPGYVIEGRVEGLAAGTVTLLRDGAYVGFTYEEVGTTEISGGRFSVGGSLEAPEMVYLQVEGEEESPRVLSRDDFEIVGVSIDFSRDAWLEAIEADGLPWTQMGDVAGFDTEPAQLFAVRSLPSNVLLGRDGTILAKDVEVDRLPEVIASLVG